MTIGERIKKVRTELGMSQVSFADKIGVSKQTLYKYENNIITNIPSDKIESIANIGGTTPSYLMGWLDEGFKFTSATKFENVLRYSNENHIPLSELMGGRNIQPCDYEGIKNARVHEVMKNYDKRTGMLNSDSSSETALPSQDPDVRRIERARQKMPEADKKFMMDMLERSFSEYFEDDGSDDPD